MNYETKVPFDLRRNEEHYLDLTAGRAINNIPNEETFISCLYRKLGDQLRARFIIEWNENNLEIEVQNFDFHFSTRFFDIKDSVGKPFLVYYVTAETVRRYRNHVNKLFFRHKDSYI